MRRILTCALMITLLLLCACSQKDPASEDFDAFRQTLNSMDSIALTAKVSTDYDAYVFDCTLQFVWQREDDTATVSVLEPEGVKGVVAKMVGGEWHLGYDTVLLGAGDIAGRTLAPITAPQRLFKAWQSAPLIAVRYEDEGKTVRATLSGEDDGQTAFELWFDSKTFLPIRAEIAENGHTVIKVVFIY